MILVAWRLNRVVHQCKQQVSPSTNPATLFGNLAIPVCLFLFPRVEKMHTSNFFYLCYWWQVSRSQRFRCQWVDVQHSQVPLFIRVSQQNMFFWKSRSPTQSCGIWVLVWRIPKGFLILTTFRGCTRPLKIWLVLATHAGVNISLTSTQSLI